MKRFLFLLIIAFLPIAFINAQEESPSAMYAFFDNNINNAFYFVVDKIIDLQSFFLGKAWEIGSVILLIAILSAALNYALTGTGLKENIIKIMKATVFFLIVFLAYPKIVSFITSWTFSMAQDSVYPSIKEYFDTIVGETEDQYTVQITTSDTSVISNRLNFTNKIIRSLKIDNANLFSDIEHTQKHPQMQYTTVAPAAVIKIILNIAGQCILYADNKENIILPEFSRILKGLICAFFAMVTGVFALLEYIVCFLEFMLVTSVGVILFPLSIWEGSKFMSEKFIGAVIGFFMKLLFCNIAIFLMLYGFLSLFYIINFNNGFSGTPDQIIFVIFTSLLFFFICKSAPGIAQSLLTGTPSLSASGAISAVGGMVAAAGATMHMAKSAGSIGKSVAGGVAKAGFAAHGAFSEAKAAAGAVAGAGGTGGQQAGAFFSSLGSTAKDAVSAGGLGLLRSLTGGNNTANPHSWRERFNNAHDENGEQLQYFDTKNKDGTTKKEGYIGQRQKEGAKKGLEYLRNHP